MSKLSKKTIDFVAESVLGVLFDSYPSFLSARAVSERIRRDKEFVMFVLSELESKKLVRSSPRPSGRKLWSLSPAAKRAFDGS